MSWKLSLAFLVLIIIVGYLLHMHFYRSFDVNKFEHLVFNKVNEIRVKHGLKPLIWNNMLYAKAKKHAGWMAETGRLEHSSLGPGMGENIYYTPYYGSEETVAEETVEAWMESPGHRRNMLDPLFLSGAVAATKTDEGIYVVLLLGG